MQQSKKPRHLTSCKDCGAVYREGFAAKRHICRPASTEGKGTQNVQA